MFWSERSFRSRIIAAAALALALVAGGCNVRPLYGTAATTGNDTVSAALADIEVNPVEGRVGQQIYNDLNAMLNAGGAGDTTYALSFTVRSQYANIITRTVSGLPGGRNVRLTVRYQLRKKDQMDVPILAGGVVRIAPYDYFTQRFANDRAQIDAENRASREIAEDIRTRLAAYFATGQVPSVVTAPTDGIVPDEFKDTLFDTDTSNYGVSY